MGRATLPTDIETSVIRWRQHLHHHPELSFLEVQTSAYVEAELRRLDAAGRLAITRPTPTSVLAVLPGDPAVPTLLIRADMDALPIQEENDLPFASARPGVMHACGHDGHTAMLLGAVQLLLAEQAPSGEVRFLFQHAEETPPGGAVELVAAGVMDGVALVLGAHMWAAGPTGRIGLSAGPNTAAPDAFQIRLRGRGGHGAMPHQTVDPVLVAGHLITALQSVASRSVDPLESVVVSVTQLQAGSAYNIIPDEALLSGTVRTLTPELRDFVPRRMAEIADGVAAAFGAQAEFSYTQGYPSVTNDLAFTALVREVAAEVVGSEAVVPIPPTMAGEDFAYYQQRAPGCFFSVGCGNPALGITYPHHHPRFNLDDAALKYGTLIFARTALRLAGRST